LDRSTVGWVAGLRRAAVGLFDLVATMSIRAGIAALPWWALHIAKPGEWTWLLYVAAAVSVSSSLWFFWQAARASGSWQAEKTVLPITNRANIVITLVAAVSQLLGAFATLYWLRSVAAPGSFNEPLSKIDAAYFAMTVFSTTGFGDIHATSGGARLLVMAQMAVDLVLLSVLLVLVMSRAAAALSRH
jgi:hypothetical protein